MTNPVELIGVHAAIRRWPREVVLRQLYNWLDERTVIESISHARMPSYPDHCRFVTGHRYAAWYVIAVAGKANPDYPSFPRLVGNIYLTDQNEIGIHIGKEHRAAGYGSAAIELLRKKHSGPFFANINPGNERSVAFFTKHGAKLIQHTYKLPD